jgi:HSP20 family molecular chaperone IbpA
MEAKEPKELVKTEATRPLPAFWDVEKWFEGVLEIRVPKTEETKKKEVKVKID